MSSVGREISDLKMNAYAKLHIPKKEEMMEDIIAIGKTIADSLKMPRPAEDVYAVFVENNNRDLEFYGFAGDGAGTIDSKGNLVHIGDSIEMTHNGKRIYSQYAIKILPKQKTIDYRKGRVVQSYKEFPAKCKKDTKGLFTVVSCLDAYLKSINQSSLNK